MNILIGFLSKIQNSILNLYIVHLWANQCSRDPYVDGESFKIEKFMLSVVSRSCLCLFLVMSLSWCCFGVVSVMFRSCLGLVSVVSLSWSCLGLISVMSRCCFGDVSVMSRSCLCLFLVMSRCCFGVVLVLSR